MAHLSKQGTDICVIRIHEDGISAKDVARSLRGMQRVVVHKERLGVASWTFITERI